MTKHILETIGILCIKQYLLFEKPFETIDDYRQKMKKSAEISRELYDLIILVKDKIGPIGTETEKPKPQEESGSLKNWQHLHILSNLLNDEKLLKKDPFPEWTKKSMENLL